MFLESLVYLGVFEVRLDMCFGVWPDEAATISSTVDVCFNVARNVTREGPVAPPAEGAVCLGV